MTFRMILLTDGQTDRQT